MPRTLHTIGLVPGILVIFGVALITTWADMIIGVFKKAHPSVYTLADVGQILFGKTGREIMGFAYWVSLGRWTVSLLPLLPMFPLLA